MVKNKIISSIIFSLTIFLLILFGSLYAAGKMGTSIVNKELTPEGKLGAGLISITILVWLWSAAIIVPTLVKWKNKSLELTIILLSTLFLMPITFTYGIFYLITKKDSNEKVTTNNEITKGIKNG